MVVPPLASSVVVVANAVEVVGVADKVGSAPIGGEVGHGRLLNTSRASVLVTMA